MTRDSYRVHDDRGSHQDDADIFAALSRTGSFARLPEDAPPELKDITVEIEDPKRVYTVYRAGRRHNFQLLVERYIHQIRYGCLSKACTTVTCFSCRRRLANGAPVRRYNATSARTLAVYMASQDNPEQGLCRNPVAPRPTAEKPKPNHVGTDNGAKEFHMPKSTSLRHTSRGNRAHAKGKPMELGDGTSSSISQRSERSEDTLAKQQNPKEGLSDLMVIDEPANIDPRSFVQNMFGTVAFKMVEWLTPRNLDLLMKSNENNTRDLKENSDTSNPTVTNSNDERATIELPGSMQKEQAKLPSSQCDDQEGKDVGKAYTASKNYDPTSQPVPISSSQLSHTRESKMSPGSDNIRQASLSRLLSATKDPLESHHSKAILSKVLKPVDRIPDTTHHSRQYSPVQRKLSRRSSRNSSGGCDKDGLLHTVQDTSNTRIVDTKPDFDESKEVLNKVHNAKVYNWSQENQKQDHESRIGRISSTLLPQSLSHLSIETIEFLCTILQNDGNAEDHILHPNADEQNLRRRRPSHAPLYRFSKVATGSSKLVWKLFIEQSLFDVLGRPDTLLRTFRNDKNCLFDTQTIWYLMLRLTTVIPSLVLDSLWRVAAGLFQVPRNLQSTNEWVKDATRNHHPDTIISNHDAGDIINICLHALVATVPLATQQDLASMSRIRSYGLATRGSESASEDLTTLCVQYDDAFTYDPGMRLARRIFSAIPARRRFADLLDSQKGDAAGEKFEPDVLETIIKSLKSLDLDSETALPFTEIERDVHEKRMPTLLLDWARAVMLQEWQGAATVPNDGALGGALATIDVLFKNRKALLLGDIHFRTEYFAERLDPVEMPSSWLHVENSTRTTHLLDYPYLFNPSTLVTYFRAINFARMNRAYETAKATSGLMYSTMAESSLMQNKNRRDQLYRRLDTATTKFNVLEIGRTEVLKDTFNSIWRREEREILRPLKVRLGQNDGDEGMDSGGVQQEFFRLAIAEAVNPDYGAFTIDASTKMIWFQPSSPEPLWKFELIGMVVSLAIYNGLTLPVTFPKALYMKLLHEEVCELHHIEDGWPDIAKSLTSLLEWDEKDGAVEDIFVLSYEFSADLFGVPVSCEMGAKDQWPQFTDSRPTPNPDAPMVTNENRNNYVSDYIRWMTDISIRPQFEAFRKGFFSCVDRRSISLFDADTLQSLVEGIQEIDIPEMRRATNYVGWSPSHRTVREFWSIVKRYSLDQKRKLLEFTTASDRVPVGGMKNLQFTLQRNGVDDDHLPTSYTCYGILLLPEYSSKEVLREKLAMALENSKGFGFA